MWWMVTPENPSAPASRARSNAGGAAFWIGEMMCIPGVT